LSDEIPTYNGADTIISWINPNGKNNSIILSSQPAFNLKRWAVFGDAFTTTVSHDFTKMYFGDTYIVDLRTLSVIDFSPLEYGYIANAFSPDGRYLYLLKSGRSDNNRSLAVDSQTGKIATELSTKGYRIAANPVGGELAVSMGRGLFSRVKIFSVKPISTKTVIQRSSNP
jgi:DNA-binding beta-propeller fold protein YncE